MTMMAEPATPIYDRNSFLFKKILEKSPENALSYSRGMLNKWTRDWSKDEAFAKRMVNFEKKQCMLLVWLSNKFGRKADDSVEEQKTYRLLCEKYDHLVRMDIVRIIDEAVGTGDIDPALHNLLPSLADMTAGDYNAEKDRYSKRQQLQHLVALLYLRQAAIEKLPLSEKLIKNAHMVLMWQLHNDDGQEIHAGQYRQCTVRTGAHVYPDWECVPRAMPQRIKDYDTKFKDDHDAFQVASVLLYEVLAIHPFLDGNGRLSRLLWCYSLIKDGLPFPVTPFPGLKKKAYKTYINCIDKDQDAASSRIEPPCSNLASLTLISVIQTWKNFVLNLRSESPESHQHVIEWLQNENM